MRLTDFDFHLPEQLIAQEPVYPRDHSRLFVYDRSHDIVSHKQYFDLANMLSERDVLVVNNTKVFPARLIGYKKTGAKVEVFLVRQHGSGLWQVLLGKGGKKRVGQEIIFNDAFKCTIVGKNTEQVWLVQFNLYGKEFWQQVYAYGQVPLPPYIKRPSTLQEYQTAYAEIQGSVAAPTAGFHFTDDLLQKLQARGVTITNITLHVGLGTFASVTTEDITQHHMHAEWGEVSKETAHVLQTAQQAGKRIIAVGTTSARTLESFVDNKGLIQAGDEWIDLFMYPGYTFRAVSGLITNFHLPKSTLIMLVAAFLGQQKTPEQGVELVHKLYKEAIEHNYRFYSFGDGMFLF